MGSADSSLFPTRYVVNLKPAKFNLVNLGQPSLVIFIYRLQIIYFRKIVYIKKINNHFNLAQPIPYCHFNSILFRSFHFMLTLVVTYFGRSFELSSHNLKFADFLELFLMDLKAYVIVLKWSTINPLARDRSFCRMYFQWLFYDTYLWNWTAKKFYS